MSGEQPEPGAELNAGEPTVPRLAATVMLLRGGRERLEVLMVRRTPTAHFMGGAWVFPGGSVSTEEGTGTGGLRAAAIRELQEEAGVALHADAELVPFARWITPERIRTRFDTWFFLALAPPDVRVEVDGAEIVDHRWISPTDALRARDAGELLLVFPTIKQLEQLADFPSADVLVDWARGRDVAPVQPKVLGGGETARIVLPGDPGYPD